MVDRISYEEFLNRVEAQGTLEDGAPSRKTAFVCPICETVQSMDSLVAAGCKPHEVGRYIGFSCEGRITEAGGWPSRKDRSAKAKARREVRGCNWTLGGLFQVHALEVTDPAGAVHKLFALASREQAEALAKAIEGERGDG